MGKGLARRKKTSTFLFYENTGKPFSKYWQPTFSLFPKAFSILDFRSCPSYQNLSSGNVLNLKEPKIHPEPFTTQSIPNFNNPLK